MNGPIKPRRDSHWYDRDGKPCYEVPYADPRKGMRKADMKDARKHGWFPSVTSILKIVDRPYLNAWIANQAIEACVRLSQELDRSLTEADHPDIKERAEAISVEAREKGSAYHRAVEKVMLDFSAPPVAVNTHGLPEATFIALVDLFFHYDLKPRHLERPFVSLRWGYGGRLDFEGIAHIRPDDRRQRYTILDYKTQNTKGTGEFTVYPEVPCQLAAYAVGVGKPCADLGTVYIDTSIDDNVALIYHPDNDEYFQSFVNAFKVWKDPILGKNFEPTGRRTR